MTQARRKAAIAQWEAGSTSLYSSGNFETLDDLTYNDVALQMRHKIHKRMKEGNLRAHTVCIDITQNTFYTLFWKRALTVSAYVQYRYYSKTDNLAITLRFTDDLSLKSVLGKSILQDKHYGLHPHDMTEESDRYHVGGAFRVRALPHQPCTITVSQRHRQS